MSARKLFYLGPQGTFTHQAAVDASESLAHAEPRGFELVPMDDVPQILAAAQRGDGWGVVAWENNVEGYVVPNLDALIDAKNLVGFARIGVNVSFDAYVAQGSDPNTAHVATAHPHGLAQCKRFIADHHLTTRPASSNAAACRDLKAGEIAFGPAICGELYDITRIGTSVQDYQGAATDFLVLARRARKPHACSTNHAPNRTSNTNRCLPSSPGHRSGRARRPARRDSRRGTQHDQFHLTAHQRAYRHIQLHRNPRCGPLGAAFP